MQMKFFSIIVVALNPGEKLKETLKSIASQTFQDYEVIVKDGGSTDGSVQAIEDDEVFIKCRNIRLIQKKDESIYDGMNQAVEFANGRYLHFLNCGDSYASRTVLEEVASYIQQSQMEEKIPKIFYGNQYNLISHCEVYSVPKINEFALFRNVPCHQLCFYDNRLFHKRSYETRYSVRADYEHFLYCVYKEKAETSYMPIIVCNYEGGGYSETTENRKKSAEQHREITKQYMGKRAIKYRLIMFVTLAGFRRFLAENESTSHVYNGLKNFCYTVKRTLYCLGRKKN